MHLLPSCESYAMAGATPPWAGNAQSTSPVCSMCGTLDLITVPSPPCLPQPWYPCPPRPSLPFSRLARGSGEGACVFQRALKLVCLCRALLSMAGCVDHEDVDVWSLPPLHAICNPIQTWTGVQVHPGPCWVVASSVLCGGAWPRLLWDWAWAQRKGVRSVRNGCTQVSNVTLVRTFKRHP